MTSKDMPDEIWAWCERAPDLGLRGWFDAAPKQKHPVVVQKYIRADLASRPSDDAARLAELTVKYQSLVAQMDKMIGSPCEQIRHRQEVEALAEALEFYANGDYTCREEKYWNHATCPPTLDSKLGLTMGDAAKDAGEKARQALAQHRAGRG